MNSKLKDCKHCGKTYNKLSYLDVAWHEEKPYHCVEFIKVLEE